MALLHIGSESELQDNEILHIQAGCVEVSLKSSREYDLGAMSSGLDSSVGILCREDTEFFVRGACEQVDPFNVKTAPLFHEQRRYNMVIKVPEGHRAEFWHENLNIRQSISAIDKSGNILSGELNFRNDIGYSDLVIRLDGQDFLTIRIEVFPSKISYKEDYKAILEDVTNEVYNLIFDFLKSTYESYGTDSSRSSSHTEFFAIIRRIFDRFMLSADLILSNPHHQLVTEHETAPFWKVKRTDSSTLRWIEKHPEHARRSAGGVLVEKTMAVRRHVTYDTSENRFAKYMLQNTMDRLKLVKRLYLKTFREKDPQLIASIDSMVNAIHRRIDYGLFSQVSAIPAKMGMSLVFVMAPGYRELYRDYQVLKHGLSAPRTLFSISIKDLAVLYEYWCFIKLNRILRDKYELKSQDIIKVRGNELFVSLVKGQGSRVVYRNPETNEEYSLSYNQKEVEGPTVNQKPDNVLALRKNGSSYCYVFDAKYRINMARKGSYYENRYGTPGPEEDDINTMHRYRDAILSDIGKGFYERDMFGAYVLFPYSNEKHDYEKHRFYESIGKVNIGGLPFLPTQTLMVEKALDRLVGESPREAFERSVVHKGFAEQISNRNVLIGVVSDDNSFSSFISGHCFETVGTVSVNNLEYVALYRKMVGIEYYGRIVSHSAYGSHYIFQVEKWLELPKPIKAAGYGPGRIAYTNYFLLTHTSLYPELCIKTEEEYESYNLRKKHLLYSSRNSENRRSNRLVQNRVSVRIRNRAENSEY